MKRCLRRCILHIAFIEIKGWGTTYSLPLSTIVSEAGKYNLTVAAEFRWQRIQDFIATNPNCSFISPRYFTAYAEVVFPTIFFVDGRVADGQLSLENARGFFQSSQFPPDFWRPNVSVGLNGLAIGKVWAPHPIQPGQNGLEITFSTRIRPTSLSFANYILILSMTLSSRCTPTLAVFYWTHWRPTWITFIAPWMGLHVHRYSHMASEISAAYALSISPFIICSSI